MTPEQKQVNLSEYFTFHCIVRRVTCLQLFLLEEIIENHRLSVAFDAQTLKAKQALNY